MCVCVCWLSVKSELIRLMHCLAADKRASNGTCSNFPPNHKSTYPYYLFEKHVSPARTPSGVVYVIVFFFFFFWHEKKEYLRLSGSPNNNNSSRSERTENSGRRDTRPGHYASIAISKYKIKICFFPVHAPVEHNYTMFYNTKCIQTCCFRGKT